MPVARRDQYHFVLLRQKKEGLHSSILSKNCRLQTVLGSNQLSLSCWRRGFPCTFSGHPSPGLQRDRRRVLPGRSVALVEVYIHFLRAVDCYSMVLTCLPQRPGPSPGPSPGPFLSLGTELLADAMFLHSGSHEPFFSPPSKSESEVVQETLYTDPSV